MKRYAIQGYGKCGDRDRRAGGPSSLPEPLQQRTQPTDTPGGNARPQLKL